MAAEVPGGRQLRYRLHPPMLKALGWDRKIALGAAWARPALQALARGKGLRGTPLDPFGRTAIRRLERELRDDYRAMVLRLAADLTADTYPTAVAAAEAADLVRGYEDVKLAGVQRYRAPAGRARRRTAGLTVRRGARLVSRQRAGRGAIDATPLPVDVRPAAAARRSRCGDRRRQCSICRSGDCPAGTLSDAGARVGRGTGAGAAVNGGPTAAACRPGNAALHRSSRRAVRRSQ